MFREREAGDSAAPAWGNAAHGPDSRPNPDLTHPAASLRRPPAGGLARWRVPLPAAARTADQRAKRYHARRPVQPTNGQNGTPPRRRTWRTAGRPIADRPSFPPPVPVRFESWQLAGTVRFTSPRPNHVPVPTRFERAIRRVGHSYHVVHAVPRSPPGPADGFYNYISDISTFLPCTKR